jgi:hypothetical protein
MKTSINILMTCLGVLSALPSNAIATGWNPAKLANIASPAATPVTPASGETIGLAELLQGKTYGNITAPQDYTFSSSAGEVKLVKGTPIANGIPLGTVAAFKDLTLKTALEAIESEIDADTMNAEELEFLKEIPLKDLLTADPSLKTIKADVIGWVAQGNKSLADIAKTALGDKPLPESVLKATKIGQLGNIANTPFGKFPGAEKLAISKFPGLPKVPIAKTITAAVPAANLPSGIHMVRIDKVRTQEQGNGVNPKIVTGSDQRPKAQWTSAEPVNVVEIRDSLITNKTNLVNGALMVDGSSQMIPGGNVPSPLQPTALAIPGTNLAVSVHDLDAKKGSARLQLNMRLEFMFGLRTAYFIPIPISQTVTEKGKTTFLFPLEILQPSPVAVADVVKTPVDKAALLNPVKLTNVDPQNVTTAKSLVPPNNPVVTNIANGNIGIAVKTNAFNPANEGV